MPLNFKKKHSRVLFLSTIFPAECKCSYNTNMYTKRTITLIFDEAISFKKNHLYEYRENHGRVMPIVGGWRQDPRMNRPCCGSIDENGGQLWDSKLRHQPRLLWAMFLRTQQDDVSNRNIALDSVCVLWSPVLFCVGKYQTTVFNKIGCTCKHLKDQNTCGTGQCWEVLWPSDVGNMLDSQLLNISRA